MTQRNRNAHIDYVRASVATPAPLSGPPLIDGPCPCGRKSPPSQQDCPPRRQWVCAGARRGHARPEVTSDSFVVTSAGQLVWIPVGERTEWVDPTPSMQTNPKQLRGRAGWTLH